MLSVVELDPCVGILHTTTRKENAKEGVVVHRSVTFLATLWEMV